MITKLVSIGAFANGLLVPDAHHNLQKSPAATVKLPVLLPVIVQLAHGKSVGIANPGLNNCQFHNHAPQLPEAELSDIWGLTIGVALGLEYVNDHAILVYVQASNAVTIFVTSNELPNEPLAVFAHVSKVWG